MSFLIICTVVPYKEVSYDSRVRWKMPSHALMWERKAFPRPWPAWAPFTRPAMSTTLRNAGILLQGEKMDETETSSALSYFLYIVSRSFESRFLTGWDLSAYVSTLLNFSKNIGNKSSNSQIYKIHANQGWDR